VCCKQATQNAFIQGKSWKSKFALVQYTQPSEFGGWLSVQAGGRHLMNTKLFFKPWRNLQ
jgi:hypothetical protein